MSVTPVPQADMARTRLEGGALEVVLHRRYAVPVEKLWAAVSTPERFSAWMGGAGVEMEPRVGGRFAIDFAQAGKRVDGQVVVFDPPRTIAWTWPMRDHMTVVRFEVEPDGDGARLTLTHSNLPPDNGGGGVRGGWHTHLVALPDALEGRPTTWETVLARQKVIEPLYPSIT